MRGALLMMGSMAAFTLGDASIKAIGQALPLAQVIFLRGLVACVFILVLARRLGQLRPVPRGDLAPLLLRSACEAAATYFFLSALLHMPLADLAALMQMLPLTVTLGAALVFREAVGWRRWLAIALGFVGMVLIVRPGGDGISIHSAYGLAAVASVTVRDLATRRISTRVPSLTVTLCAALSVLALSGVWSLGTDWAPLSMRAGALLLAASVFIIAAYACSVMTMRVGDMGFIAPFRYTSLVWALVLGFVVFGDWPDGLTLLGAAIIVATGLYTLWREVRAGRKKPA